MFTKAKQTFHPLPYFYVPPGFCFLARGLKTTRLPPLVRTLARDIQRCSSYSPPQGAGNSFYSPHFLALWLNLQPSDYTGLEHQAETFMEYCSSCTLYSLCYLIFTHRGVTAAMHVVEHFMPCSWTHSRVSGNYDHLPSRSLMNSCLPA